MHLSSSCLEMGNKKPRNTQTVCALWITHSALGQCKTHTTLCTVNQHLTYLYRIQDEDCLTRFLGMTYVTGSWKSASSLGWELQSSAVWERAWSGLKGGRLLAGDGDVSSERQTLQPETFFFAKLFLREETVINVMTTRGMFEAFGEKDHCVAPALWVDLTAPRI